MSRSDGRVGADVTEVPLAALGPEVMEDVYRRLLEPTFPHEELITMQDFISAYGTNASDPSSVMLHADEPVAVMLGEWYVHRRFLLISYMSVLDEVRGLGIGTRFMTSVLPRWMAQSLGAVAIAEVDPPRGQPSYDGTSDPAARLRFYERHGARLVPVQYFQPAIHEDSERVGGMLLLRLDPSRTGSDGALYDFLAEYFARCEGPDALEDPAVKSLLMRARDVDLDSDLWPVSRWTELVGDAHSVAEGDAEG
jgi:GNAT superfamily N-acetyltransferase